MRVGYWGDVKFEIEMSTKRRGIPNLELNKMNEASKVSDGTAVSLVKWLSYFDSALTEEVLKILLSWFLRFPLLWNDFIATKFPIHRGSKILCEIYINRETKMEDNLPINNRKSISTVISELFRRTSRWWNFCVYRGDVNFMQIQSDTKWKKVKNKKMSQFKEGWDDGCQEGNVCRRKS